MSIGDDELDDVGADDELCESLLHCLVLAAAPLHFAELFNQLPLLLHANLLQFLI